MSIRRIVAAAAIVALGACRQEMSDQPKVDTYEPAPPSFQHTSFGRPPAGTIALETETHQPTVNSVFIQRGQEQYGVFCTPCHGAGGAGDGPIVRAGFPPPPSYHTEMIRARSGEHLFEVITDGYGVMYGYGNRIPPQDRWAIIAYLRVLQYAGIEDSPPHAPGDGKLRP